MKNILFITFLLLANFLSAQTITNLSDFNKIDSRITDFLASWNISGAEVAITKDGKLIYNKAFGFADTRKSKPAQPNNLYRIASVSKPITAIGIMKLQENGLLSLTDTVFGKNKILDQPYYLDAISDTRIYNITIGELLEHTAGWDREVPCDGYSHSDPAFFPLHVSSSLKEPNPVGDSTIIKFLLRKGLDNDPGTTYAYSNVGYLILGKVIEKISKMKYDEYIEKNIFEPIGITNIHLAKNLSINRQKNEVEYICSASTLSCYGDNTKVPWQYGGFNIEAMNAHGGWIATAEDLTKLMLAVDGINTSPDILKPETINLMSKPGSAYSGYANGWFVSKDNNWWHTGSMDGTASYICRTNNGYTWAFLLNSRSNDSNEFWRAFDRLPWDCLNIISGPDSIN